MSKQTGWIYLTIRQKQIGGYDGAAFSVVRASTKFQRPDVGEVTIPLRITVDDLWFARRTQGVRIDVADPAPVDVQAQEATR